MKKLVLLFVGLNILLLGATLYSKLDRPRQPLNFLCESTLVLNRSDEVGNKVFNFSGTVVVRFKPDNTGYIWLLGDANDNKNKTTVAREVEFTYHSKDDRGIYAVKTTAHNVTPHDDTPNALIESNITGPLGNAGSYIVRQANANSYSIGSIYSPIIMCVDRS